MLIVRHGGLLSSLQDGGRLGVQALGITPGGAVDDLALRIGNAIVGNAADALAIEMNLQGLDVEFSEDTLIALTGAPLLIRATQQPIPSWRPLWVRGGTRLSFGRMLQGARSYLCVQGGIQAPTILGGAGADLRNGFGGLFGRALLAGDSLPAATQESRYVSLRKSLFASHHTWVAPTWQVSVWRDWWFPALRPLPVLMNTVDTTSKSVGSALFSNEFRVLPNSDRQGLRLQGINSQTSAVQGIELPEIALELANNASILPRQRSAGVCFGLIQLPPDGRPIVLLADHQTTGGYPVLGVVASLARSALAQARPGDMLRFRPMTLVQAHADLWQREKRLQYLSKMLQWRM